MCLGRRGVGFLVHCVSWLNLQCVAAYALVIGRAPACLFICSFIGWRQMVERPVKKGHNVCTDWNVLTSIDLIHLYCPLLVTKAILASALSRAKFAVHYKKEGNRQGCALQF